jgi:hypothetical protein
MTGITLLNLHKAAALLMSNAQDVPLCFRDSAKRIKETVFTRWLRQNYEEWACMDKCIILGGVNGCGKTFAAYYAFALIQAKVTLSDVFQQEREAKKPRYRARFKAEGEVELTPCASPPPHFNLEKALRKQLDNINMLSPKVEIGMLINPVFFNKGDELFESFMFDSGLVVVDDLGKGGEPEKMREAVNHRWFRFFNHRYEYKLPTLITTNLEMPALLDYMGSWFADRCCENGHIIKSKEGSLRCSTSS